MRTRRRVSSLLVALVLGVGAFGVSAVSAAAPAEAAGSCSITLSMWQAKNNTCTQARHYNIISGSTYKYAAWAPKGGTSAQSVCWGNVTHYGATVRI